MVSSRSTLSSPKLRANADVWWYRSDNRSNSGGDFGQGIAAKNCDDATKDTVKGDTSGRFVIYSGDNNTADRFTVTGDVFAHEMGHLLFGISDEYPNLRTYDRIFPHGTGISGPLQVIDPYTNKPFFRSVIHSSQGVPLDFKHFPTGLLVQQPMKPNAAATALIPVCGGSSDGQSWWHANTSLMQQAVGQVCRSAGQENRSLTDFNPLLLAGPGWRTNADCTTQTALHPLPGPVPLPGGVAAADFTECAR